MQFPIGLIFLGVLLILMLFGVTQRLFDKMKVKTVWAIILTAAIAVGAIIPAIKIGGMFSFSIGGFLIPVALCLYLMVRSDMADNLKGWLGSLATATAVFFMLYFIPSGTTAMRITSSVIIGLVAGGISYLLGRSWRGALISSVLGIILADITVFIVNLIRGIRTPLALGNTLVFDAIVIAGITAVVLVEVIAALRNRVTASSNAAQNLNYEAGVFHEPKEVSSKSKKDSKDHFNDQ